MNARAAALLALRLYPRLWRERYDEEVRDLLMTRRVGLRTVVDLCAGAMDAWAHRDLIPGGRRRRRVPAGLVLTICAVALVYLWNPGIRDAQSLDAAWRAAADHGQVATLLAGAAGTLFDAAAALTALSLVCLLVGAIATRRPLTFLCVLFVGPPMAFFLYFDFGESHFDLGYPMGPLGSAVTGGFFVPIALALCLAPVHVGWSERKGPFPPLRIAGIGCAVAARMIVLAWLPGAALIVLGLPGSSARFLCALAASLACGVAIASRAASALKDHPRRHAATGGEAVQG
ncbi:hypothetical protein [Sphaerisporangium rhizosphaerae]|uniref:Uncharacterized protein n=1 Tax=Sphaerisporangium rhizosphaerae TaxID=2269375 RepID=A0ABW2NTM4_9ACTN